MEDIFFIDYSKSKTFVLAPHLSTLPFGFVYDQLCLIVSAFANFFCECLIFWFDFYNFSMRSSIFICVGNKKIWHIYCEPSCEWMFVRNLYGFVGPLCYAGTFVTKSHKSKFPTASVQWSSTANIFVWIFNLK